MRGVLASLLLIATSVSGFLDGQWDHDIYTGRHWDDLVTGTTSQTNEVVRPAFLALYKPKCEKVLVNNENLVEAQMPPQQFIAYGKYDIKTTPKHVWYQHDDRDNMTARYPSNNCPEYLYFAKNSNTQSPEKYDKKSGMRVLEWMWSKMGERFTIRNERSKAIMVDIRGNKPSGFTVEPGQEVGFNSYISFILLVNEPFSGAFVYSTELSSGMNTIVIKEDDRIEQDKESWFRQQQELLLHDNNKMREWRWALAQIYLQNFKQPVLLPTMTKEGFKVRQIPKMLYKDVLQYYKDNLGERQPEFLELEPAVNQKDAKPTMVHLDQELSEKIASAVTPMMEHWLGQTTELTRMYGVREYHQGNIVRMHTARVGTQVASVVMVIDKELAGARDWDFEVLQYSGDRKRMNLKPGQMVFFESATLAHGFPYPFQGQDYAMIFIHYRPLSGWFWDIHPDGKWIMNGGEPQECIDQLITPNTYMKKARGRVRDEL